MLGLSGEDVDHFCVWLAHSLSWLALPLLADAFWCNARKALWPHEPWWFYHGRHGQRFRLCPGHRSTWKGFRHS